MLSLIELLLYIIFLFHFSNFKREYIMNAHCQYLLLFTSCHATWFPGSLFQETGNRERERETLETRLLFFPSPQASLLRAADAFRVTWSEQDFFPWPFVSDTSSKCIYREGLGRCHTGARQVAVYVFFLQPFKSKTDQHQFSLKNINKPSREKV